MDKLIHPQSGVRQGCPLLPTLSAMLLSPSICKLQGISNYISVLLYADDLLIIIHDPPLIAAQRMLSIGQELDVLREHRAHSEPFEVSHTSERILARGSASHPGYD